MNGICHIKTICISAFLLLINSVLINITFASINDTNKNYIRILQNYVDFFNKQDDIKLAYYYGSRAKISADVFDTKKVNNFGQKIVFYNGNDIYSDIDTKIYTVDVDKYLKNKNWISKICDVGLVAQKTIPATQDNIVQIICKNGNSIDISFSKIKPGMCYNKEEIKPHSVFVNKLKQCNKNTIKENNINKEKFKNDISIFFIDALNAKINLIRGDKIRLVNAKLKMDRLKVSFYRMVEIYTENYDYKSILDIQDELPNIEEKIECKLNKKEMNTAFEKLLDASVYIMKGICKKNKMNDILPLIDEFKRQYNLIQ